jgi:hypothetical protein
VALLALLATGRGGEQTSWPDTASPWPASGPVENVTCAEWGDMGSEERLRRAAGFGEPPAFVRRATRGCASEPTPDGVWDASFRGLQIIDRVIQGQATLEIRAFLLGVLSTSGAVEDRWSAKSLDLPWCRPIGIEVSINDRWRCGSHLPLRRPGRRRMIVEADISSLGISEVEIVRVS